MSGIILKQGTADDYRPVVTIASGDSVSSAVRMSKTGARGLALILPAAWTAADIGIDVSADWQNPSVWFPLQESTGARVKMKSIPTTASPRPVRLFPFEAWAAGTIVWVRLVSINTSNEAAVNQAASRELTLIFQS